MSGESSNKKQKGLKGQSIKKITLNSIKNNFDYSTNPVLALFPAVKPPKSTPFTLYTKTGKSIDLTLNDDTTSCVVGETDEIEFESKNQLGLNKRLLTGTNNSGMNEDENESSEEEEGRGGEGPGCSVQYILAIHDPTNSTLKFLPSQSTSIHSLIPSVKALKALPSTLTPSQLAIQQRAALGHTFGTKKAQRAQNTQVRNKLDETSYGNLTLPTIGANGGNGNTTIELMQESINLAGINLPEKDEIERESNLNRPIPKFDFGAKTPEEVYDMNSIITKVELDSIISNLNSIMKVAATANERKMTLIHKRSDYVDIKLKSLFPHGTGGPEGSSLKKKDQYKLALIIHITHLLTFRRVTERVSPHDTLDSNYLSAKMNLIPRPPKVEDTSPSDTPTPSVITPQIKPTPISPLAIEFLLERYTESHKKAVGVTTRVVTSKSTVKLLSYLLVLILHLDNYSSDITTIASDLSLSAKKVQDLFKSLGCSLVAPNTAERERLVSTGKATSLTEARKSKRAVLKVPLEFPKETRGAPKR